MCARQVNNNCNIFRKLDWSSAVLYWQSHTICGAWCLIRITSLAFRPWNSNLKLQSHWKRTRRTARDIVAWNFICTKLQTFHRTRFRASSVCSDSACFGCYVDKVMATAVYVFGQIIWVCNISYLSASEILESPPKRRIRILSFTECRR
jgi:hypothetical protein